MKFTIPNLGGAGGSYTCKHFLSWMATLGIGLGVMDIARGFTKGLFVYVGDKLTKKLDSEKEKIEKADSEDISEVENE